jgi:hypothetical protein
MAPSQVACRSEPELESLRTHRLHQIHCDPLPTFFGSAFGDPVGLVPGPGLWTNFVFSLGSTLHGTFGLGTVS